MSQNQLAKFLIAGACLTTGLGADPPARGWFRPRRPEWYGSAEATRIADNVLLYQRDSGGWAKSLNMATVLDDEAKTALVRQKGKLDATIDNGATRTQLLFLARVYNATKSERYRAAFFKGLDFLLAAQYPNGGWPQCYPKASGYHKHITFNDDSMIGVLDLLRAVAAREPEFAFVDESRRARAEAAIQAGVACILRCQVRVQGRLTVWCAQHDETTLEPASARIYEKVSLSGQESVSIVRFLMAIDRPSPEVVAAIEGAVAWFRTVQLTGIRLQTTPDPTQPRGRDRRIVADPTAPPLWARFYEVGTNRPIFCGRDGVVKYSLAEIEPERRNNYSWYTTAPAVVLAKDYPAWKAKQAGIETAAHADAAMR